MKRSVLTFGRVLGLCLLVTGVVVLAGCQANPDEVATQLAEAVNGQDLDGALALFADDAVVNSGGPAPFTGKAEIQGWLEGMFADNFELEIEILEVKGDKVVEKDTMTMDSVSALGIGSLEGISEITVQGGKITALNFTFTDESLAELQVAMLIATAPIHADVPYIDDGDPVHTLDVYLPEGVEGPLPTLLVLHGAEGSKEDFNFLAGYLVERGYAAVLPNYGYPNVPDRPTAFQNALCSLAWVHSSADTYGFDGSRIVVFGYSVGGLWAAMLGTVDDTSQFLEGCPHPLPESGWTQGVATYAAVLVTPEACLSEGWCLSGAAQGNKIPVTEMLEIFKALRAVPPSGWRVSDELSEETRIFAEETPLFWLDGSEPPFLLIHGSMDEGVPSGESEAFAAYLEEAGVEVELLLLPLAGHLSISPSSPSFFTIAEAVEAFVSGLFGEQAHSQ
jgi:acetyl esterase/lipase